LIIILNDRLPLQCGSLRLSIMASDHLQCRLWQMQMVFPLHCEEKRFDKENDL